MIFRTKCFTKIERTERLNISEVFFIESKLCLTITMFVTVLEDNVRNGLGSTYENANFGVWMRLSILLK